MGFLELFEYTDWANRRCESMLTEGGAELDEARLLYDHVLSAEHLWLCRMLGRPLVHDLFPTFGPQEARTLRIELEQGYTALLRSGVEPGSMVDYVTTEGESQTTPKDELLWHVVTHGNYHRGQIARIVRQAGHQPLGTDLILWSLERRA